MLFIAASTGNWPKDGGLAPPRPRWLCWAEPQRICTRPDGHRYTQMEKVLPLGAPNMESAADWKTQTGKASSNLPF